MIIKLLIDGGDMKPSPAIAQQLGPMGINIGKVISEVSAATKDFKGMQVPVDLDVDPKTKNFKISVRSPAVSALIKKELGIETASGERKKVIVGNLAIEQLISITKQKQSGMLAKEFISALKSVIGSCMSMGVLIESKDPKEVIEEIAQGKYKTEIDSKKTELTLEKKKELLEFFNKIKSKQEADKKAEEAEKAAKEAKAVEATTAAAAPGTAAAKPEEKKEEAKK